MRVAGSTLQLILLLAACGDFRIDVPRGLNIDHECATCYSDSKYGP
jgi:hypothetical protein